MAASQQQKIDNQPLAFSLKAVVYPSECWNKVLVTGCSSWSQLARIREETLESGNLFSSKLVEFCLRTMYKIQLIIPMKFFQQAFLQEDTLHWYRIDHKRSPG